MAGPKGGRLIAYTALCHGCQACMVACSLAKEGQAIPSRARLQVLVDPLEARYAIRYCHQCRRAPCARACPTGAIKTEGENGPWKVEHELCNGCGECLKACPFEAMILPGIMCDLCDGAPECVASCPSGALVWLEPSPEPASAEQGMRI